MTDVSIFTSLVLPPLPNCCDLWGKDHVGVTALMSQGTQSLHTNLKWGVWNLTNVRFWGLWEQSAEIPCRYVGNLETRHRIRTWTFLLWNNCTSVTPTWPLCADFLPLHLLLKHDSSRELTQTFLSWLLFTVNFRFLLSLIDNEVEFVP